jgi:hypothetical protein
VVSGGCYCGNSCSSGLLSLSIFSCHCCCCCFHCSIVIFICTVVLICTVIHPSCFHPSLLFSSPLIILCALVALIALSCSLLLLVIPIISLVSYSLVFPSISTHHSLHKQLLTAVVVGAGLVGCSLVLLLLLAVVCSLLLSSTKDCNSENSTFSQLKEKND